MYPIDDSEVLSNNSLIDRYKNYVDQHTIIYIYIYKANFITFTLHFFYLFNIAERKQLRRNRLNYLSREKN